MTIQLELWHLITLLIAFFGCVGAFGKLLLGQVEKRLNDRFKAQDEAREEGSKTLRETINQHLKDERATAAKLHSLERDFLLWRSDLPSRHGERLSRLESAIASAPTHEDLADLHQKINGVADGVSQLNGEFSGVKNVLNLIHEHLLRGS